MSEYSLMQIPDLVTLKYGQEIIGGLEIQNDAGLFSLIVNQG